MSEDTGLWIVPVGGLGTAGLLEPLAVRLQQVLRTRADIGARIISVEDCHDSARGQYNSRLVLSRLTAGVHLSHRVESR